MPTFGPRAIQASADDASELATTVVSITANPLANCDTTGVWNAWRFTAVNIPANATITSAYLTINFTSTTLDEPDVTIYGLDVASPAQFTTTNADISGRARTSASVDWSNTNAGSNDVNTSDISSIISELYASYGPYSNGVMGFCWTTRAADGARDTSETSYDGDTSLCARLTIVYSVAYTESFADTVGISDSISKTVRRFVAFANTVGITDTLSKSGAFLKSIINTTGITDSISKVGTFVRSLPESLGITDLISYIKTGGGDDFFATIGDSLGITDSLSKIGSFFRTLTNTEEITTSLTNTRSLIVALVNNVGITDVIVTSKTIIRTITDSIGIRDFYHRTALININHETGDLSQYTSTVTDSGDLSVTTTATLAGTGYGLLCFVDDANPIYGQKDLGADNTSGQVRSRFYINRNDISIPNGQSWEILSLQSAIGSGNILRFWIRNSAGNYQVYFLAYRDGGTTSSGFVNLTAVEHYIELHVVRASGDGITDGYVNWWIDGAAQTSVTDIDNYTEFPYFRSTRFGIAAIGGGSGSLYLDELVINDSGYEIGQVKDLNTSAFFVRNILISVGITDSISKIGTFIKSLSDSIGITDILSTAKIVLVSLSNSVGITDVLTKLVGFARSITDTEEITTSISKAANFFRTQTESLGITDILSRSKGAIVYLADSLGIADAISNAKIIVKSLSDSVGITDSISKIGAFYRNLANNVSITDVLSKTGIFLKSLSNSVGITDSVSKAGTFFKSISDSIGISDVLATAKIVLVTLSDVLGITDTLSKIGTFVRALTSTEGITDTLTKIGTFVRSFSDSIGITDLLSAVLLGAQKFASLVDSVSITDTLSKIGTFVRTISNAENISDVLSKIGTYIRTILTSESISDSLSVSKVIQVLIQNIVNITDILQATIVSIFTESIVAIRGRVKSIITLSGEYIQIISKKGRASLIAEILGRIRK